MTASPSSQLPIIGGPAADLNARCGICCKLQACYISTFEAKLQEKGGNMTLDHLNFGIFLAPFHPLDEDPTAAMDRDMALLVHLDGGT